MANTYLTRANASAPTLGTKFTFSVWVKLGVSSTTIDIFNQPETTHVFCMMEIKPQLDVQLKNGSGTTYVRRRTNRQLRDINGWYNLVLTYDSTLGTAEDRLKIFINGERQSSWVDTTGTVDQNMVIPITANTEDVRIGTNGAANSAFFNGSMSHLHFIDGLAYEASTFGSTDSTTGEWKINTSPTISSYGNNGFLILKDGNTITDQSPNSNNLTLGGGTLTKTEDCPDNVFATINPLYKHSATYANGNLKSTNASNKFGGVATIGVSTGKYYAEFKYGSASNQNGAVGIYGNPQLASNNNQGVGKEANSYSYRSDDGYKVIENTSSSYGNTFASGDIIGIALDLDNNKLYFSKNGTWQNSGVPTSGSTGTGSIPISLTPSDGCWFISANCNSASDTAIWEHNYGNGYFGTTAVSSAGTNASGIGIFEYDVPAGYTALSTKGLNL